MQEPSRQLGYHTAVNNMITQVFLKARAITLIFFVSLAAAAVLTYFLVQTPVNAVLYGYIKVFQLYGFNAFTGAGLQDLKFYDHYFLFYFIEALKYLVIFFIIIFLVSFAVIKRKSAILYQKKYIRGIQVLPARQFLKLIKKEAKNE